MTVYIPPEADIIKPPPFIPTEQQLIPQLRCLARVKLMHFDPVLNLSQFIRVYSQEKRKDDGKGTFSVKEVCQAYNEYIYEHGMKAVRLNGVIKKILILHKRHFIIRSKITIKEANAVGLTKMTRSKYFTLKKEKESNVAWDNIFERVR